MPVLPVSQWGAHEVFQYANDGGKLRTVVRPVVGRPALKVHIGPPGGAVPEEGPGQHIR